MTPPHKLSFGELIAGSAIFPHISGYCFHSEMLLPRSLLLSTSLSELSWVLVCCSSRKMLTLPTPDYNPGNVQYICKNKYPEISCMTKVFVGEKLEMLKLWTYFLWTVVIPLRGEGCWVIVKKGKKEKLNVFSIAIIPEVRCNQDRQMNNKNTG